MKYIVLLICLLLLSGCFASPSTPSTAPPTQSPSQDFDAIDSQMLEEYDSAPPEPRSDDMVNYITLLAREQAQYIDDELTHEALSYIAAHIADPDIFEDQDTMELVMYYGALLDYAYKNDSDKRSVADVGWDAFRAVKYVYREAETPKDAEHAIEQAIEGLFNLGYHPGGTTPPE
jgi:hypothetical protein